MDTTAPTIPSPPPLGVPPLYLAARFGDPVQLLQLLDATPPPSLFSLGPNGSLPLHAVAWAQSPACVAVLMDRHVALNRAFDPKCLPKKFGENPVECARGQPECLRALGLRPDAPRHDAATVRRVVRTHNRAFVYAVAESPPIGDRHVPFCRTECPLPALVAGLVREERIYFKTAATFGTWLKQREQWVARDLPAEGSAL